MNLEDYTDPHTLAGPGEVEKKCESVFSKYGSESVQKYGNKSEVSEALNTCESKFLIPKAGSECIERFIAVSLCEEI